MDRILKVKDGGEKSNLKTNLSDEQTFEGLKNKLVRDNLKELVRTLVDFVNDQQYNGKMNGDDRKYWHGLMLSLAVDCTHDLMDDFEKAGG